MNEQDDILIAEDWWLKPSLLPTRVWSYDKGTNGGYIADYKSIGLDIRLVGTKNQINKWRKETGVEVKDIWDTELTEEHKKLYKRNCNKLVVIRLV
tara:strand:- start:163 stop:450 length:288 start_codon:yes stop_codon:yes gene_type:complete